MAFESDDWELPEEPTTKDVPQKTRAKVLKRDKYRCRRCGEEELEKLTLHHIEYRSQGGTHASDNLVTVCMRCHNKFHQKLMKVININGHFFFHDTTHWRFSARQVRSV